jgi:hypothetical protein
MCEGIAHERIMRLTLTPRLWPRRGKRVNGGCDHLPCSGGLLLFPKNCGGSNRSSTCREKLISTNHLCKTAPHGLRTSSTTLFSRPTRLTTPSSAGSLPRSAKRRFLLRLQLPPGTPGGVLLLARPTYLYLLPFPTLTRFQQRNQQKQMTTVSTRLLSTLHPQRKPPRTFRKSLPYCSLDDEAYRGIMLKSKGSGDIWSAIESTQIIISWI